MRRLGWFRGFSGSADWIGSNGWKRALTSRWTSAAWQGAWTPGSRSPRGISRLPGLVPRQPRGAARTLARPRELASAYDVLASVQGVIGDLDGLKRYVAEGLREARKAHTPLRARVEDIPVLANHFSRHAVAQTGSRASLDPATFAALARYDRPGNVRELQNVMTALAVSAPRRGRVAPSLLPAAIAGASSVGAARLEDARRTFEQRFVRAATDLGLSRQGFAELLGRLGLRHDQG